MTGPRTPAKKATAAKRTPAKNRSVVTGVDLAYVNLPDGTVADIREGQTLPETVTDAERDRLDALGVFGEHRRVGVQRRLDDMVRAGLARVGLAATGTVTEAPADDEPDGGTVDEPLTPIVDPDAGTGED